MKSLWEVRIRRKCDLCDGEGGRMDMANGNRLYWIRCRQCRGTGQVEDWISIFDLKHLIREIEKEAQP